MDVGTRKRIFWPAAVLCWVASLVWFVCARWWPDMQSGYGAALMLAGIGFMLVAGRGIGNKGRF